MQFSRRLHRQELPVGFDCPLNSDLQVLHQVVDLAHDGLRVIQLDSVLLLICLDPAVEIVHLLL